LLIGGLRELERERVLLAPRTLGAAQA